MRNQNNLQSLSDRERALACATSGYLRFLHVVTCVLFVVALLSN